MKEIWKNLPEFEGLYLISNLGRVKSLPRNTTKGKIIKQNIRNGYCVITLRKNKKCIGLSVHRLVAQVFVKNPNNFKEVNHINGIKTDNKISNLEWVNRSQNMQHAYKTGLKKVPVGSENKTSKKVKQYTLDGKFIKVWGCISDITRNLKINDGNISLCCKGKRKTAGGYIWKYAKE